MRFNLEEVVMTKIKDPVCGMQVDTDKTQYKTEHGGKQYAFCCQECKNKFEKDPKEYSNN